MAVRSLQRFINQTLQFRAEVIFCQAVVGFIRINAVAEKHKDQLLLGVCPYRGTRKAGMAKSFRRTIAAGGAGQAWVCFRLVKAESPAGAVFLFSGMNS